MCRPIPQHKACRWSHKRIQRGKYLTWHPQAKLLTPRREQGHDLCIQQEFIVSLKKDLLRALELWWSRSIFKINVHYILPFEEKCCLALNKLRVFRLFIWGVFFSWILLKIITGCGFNLKHNQYPQSPLQWVKAFSFSKFKIKWKFRLVLIYNHIMNYLIFSRSHSLCPY